MARLPLVSHLQPRSEVFATLLGRATSGTPKKAFGKCHLSSVKTAGSERLEKGDQIPLLLFRKANPESTVIERHDMLEIRSCAVMEVGGPGGQIAQHRTFGLADIFALAADQCLARI